MPISFDPMALFVAALALWLTIREIKRNNCVILDIRECEGSTCQQAGENNCQFFHYLKVLIRNDGITLFNVQLALTYQLPKYGGGMSVHFQRKDDNSLEQNTFSRGMIAEFHLKSYLYDPFTIDRLIKLENLVKQNARLRVYSQGYLAKEIRISTLWDRLKLKWNKLAYRMNGKFEKVIQPEGEKVPLIISRKVLPVFKTLTDQVMYFISELKRDAIPTNQPTIKE
jgi:hypothetical protein